MNAHADEFRRFSAALRAAGEDAQPRSDCPPADRIWDAVQLDLPPDERLAIVDHTVECPVCAEAWRLAVEVGQQAGMSDRQPPHAAARTPAARLLLYAATIVLAVGVLAYVRWSNPTPAPVDRDAAALALRSGIEQGAALPRDDLRLRWSGGPDEARYDLTVTTSDLDVVVSARGLERPEYTIPAERAAQLTPGTRLLWRVVAHAPDGATVSSPTFEVSVR